MKIRAILLLLTASTALLWSSCDKMGCPYEEGCDLVIDTSETDTTRLTWSHTNRSPENIMMRNILIEEFTGHTCKECPEGAVEIERLAADHSPQVIAVAIHAGGFADPVGGIFTTDYRTEAGEDYLQFFNVEWYPSGMISRIGDGTTKMLGRDQWAPIVTGHITDLPPARIDLTNFYNDTTRYLRSQVSVEWLADMSANEYKLQLYCIEDSLVSPQLDDDSTRYDYVHRHNSAALEQLR